MAAVGEAVNGRADDISAFIDLSVLIRGFRRKAVVTAGRSPVPENMSRPAVVTAELFPAPKV